MNCAAIVQWLGGAEAVGAPVRSDLDWIDVWETGVLPAAVDAAIEHQLLSRAECERLVIRRRTLQRRRQRGERLTSEETDRLLRVARIHALAEHALGDFDAARGWLREPRTVLRGASPLDLLRTDAGARLVREILLRIRSRADVQGGVGSVGGASATPGKAG
jgi:putative toxin-antitoxin system antitoxin component (TIGR02293 family)